METEKYTLMISGSLKKSGGGEISEFLESNENKIHLPEPSGQNKVSAMWKVFSH
jgi:hypothetical protein